MDVSLIVILNIFALFIDCNCLTTLVVGGVTARQCAFAKQNRCFADIDDTPLNDLIPQETRTLQKLVGLKTIVSRY